MLYTMKTSANTIDIPSQRFIGRAFVFLALAIYVTMLSCSGMASSIPTLTGLVGWWPGDGNCFDAVGSNHGTAIGSVSYAPGEVGNAFKFDGKSTSVQLGNPDALRLQDFTIEAWIQRADTNVASLDIFHNGAILQYGWNGFGFALADDGRLLLGKVGIGAVYSTRSLKDTNFHHVAVSKSGSSVVFYLDGIEDPAPAYNAVFEFNEPVAIGASGNGLACFLGLIDEASIYNRALSQVEVQTIHEAGTTGKTHAFVKPFIRQQPESQVAYYGEDFKFELIAIGAEPLSYQWLKDGVALAGATNSTLVLSNLQLADAGSYTVVVSNNLGSVISSEALLAVSVAGVSIGLYAGVQIEGTVGITYGIQCTTDLSQPSSWIGLTNITLTQPVQLWYDRQPANQPKRFYKVVLGPISVP